MRNVTLNNAENAVSLIIGIAENKVRAFTVGAYFTGDADIGIYGNLMLHWSKNLYVDVYNLCDIKIHFSVLRECVLKNHCCICVT